MITDRKPLFNDKSLSNDHFVDFHAPVPTSWNLLRNKTDYWNCTGILSIKCRRSFEENSKLFIKDIYVFI